MGRSIAPIGGTTEVAPHPHQGPGVAQALVGPESPVMDGGALGRVILDLLVGGKFDEVEAMLNTSSREEVQAMLDAEGTFALEARYTKLSTRGKQLAAWILSQSARTDVSGFLAIQLRGEPEEEVRQSLVLALQARPDDEAGRGLRSSLGGDPAEGVRAAAAYALGDRLGKDPLTLQDLATRLSGDPAETVRVACAAALGLYPSQECTNALYGALDAESVEVRIAAVNALGQQQGFASVDRLAAREVTEPDPRVRAALVEAQMALRKELTIDKIEGCDRPIEKDQHDDHR